NYNDYNRRGYNLIFGDHAYHYYWYTYSYSHWHQKKNQVEIITDRSIYRPNQKMYFKLYCISPDGEILPDENLEMEISYGGVSIKKLELTCNEYGTYSDSIDIPASSGKR